MYLESGEVFWALAAFAAYAITMHVRIGTWKKRAAFVTDTNKYRDEVEAALRIRDAETRKAEGVLKDDRAKLEHERGHLRQLLDRTSRVFPWAAKIHGDILAAEADKLSRDLQAKRHPAFKSAEAVQEFKRSVRERLERAKFGEYKALVYETAFPFLPDFFEGAPTEELAAVGASRVEDDDPVKNWLSEAEYARMTPTERSQRALERYVKRKKTSWEIGRDYERYIGYQYEKLGWEVEYHGANRGLEDLGRDLIARGNGQTIIIQCKYWGQWKDIHENAVFQLFGSVVDYLFEHKLLHDGEDVFQALKRNGLRGLFVTSTNLSERALIACKALGIEVNATMPLEPDYPRIKCNVGKNEKLYHLPFDQQYDRIKIEPSKGEFYATTCAEAEAAGFRRVYRWRPQS
jgi:hypothetical protein